MNLDVLSEWRGRRKVHPRKPSLVPYRSGRLIWKMHWMNNEGTEARANGWEEDFNGHLGGKMHDSSRKALSGDNLEESVANLNAPFNNPFLLLHSVVSTFQAMKAKKGFRVTSRLLLGSKLLRENFMKALWDELSKLRWADNYHSIPKAFQ